MSARTFLRRLVAALGRDTPAFGGRQRLPGPGVDPQAATRRRSSPPTRSPLQMYVDGGGNLADASPRLQAIMWDAEMKYRAEEASGSPTPPITGNDSAALNLLSGANFSGDVRIILPSGEQLDANSAQAWTSVYDDDKREEK